jgi:hypothetical protein
MTGGIIVAATIQEIENEMDEIRMLMKIWNKFYRILTTTFYNEDADISELDREFQQIKQVVAEHHGHFMKVIKKDFHIGQSVLTTVKRTISLEGFQNLSPLEINKTLIEWHDANILLNETLGSLEADRDRIQRGRAKKLIDAEAEKKSAMDFFKSKTFKNVINLVIFLAIVGGIYMYWDPIVQSSFYQDYLAGFVDPILGLFGLEPTAIEQAAEEAANG